MPEDEIVEYDPKADGPVVDFGLGYFLPPAIKATFTRKSLPCKVEIRAVLENGRFNVEYVRASRRGESGSVTLENLRDIPVAHLVPEAILTLLYRFETPHASMAVKHRGLKGIAKDIVPMLAKNITEGDELEHVAVLYRIAYTCGYPPTRMVMEAMGVSRATAGRWIADARHEGLLGAAIERRPGERKTTRRRRK